MVVALPITLVTAGTLTLVKLVLAFRVGKGRALHNVSLGDANNNDMLVRIRSHANFTEYVPTALILLGFLELGGANRTVLSAAGLALVIFRIAHPIGMPMKRNPNPFRAGAAIGTFLLLLTLAVYSIALAISHR